MEQPQQTSRKNKGVFFFVVLFSKPPTPTLTTKKTKKMQLLHTPLKNANKTQEQPQQSSRKKKMESQKQAMWEACETENVSRVRQLLKEVPSLLNAPLSIRFYFS